MKLRFATALMLALSLWTAPFSLYSYDDKLVRRLQSELQEIPYVDTHTHIPDPRGFNDSFKDRKYDVIWLLGQGTYVAEFTSGSNWAEIKKSLAVNGHHAYYRPILEAFRDLYGLGAQEELNDGNYQKVSERMDAAHRRDNVAWYQEVLGKRSNLKHLVWLNDEKRSQAEMPAPYFHPMWNTDGFIYVSEPDKKHEHWPLDSLGGHYGVKLNSLPALEKMISTQVEDFFNKGGVGLKSTSAYFRALDFDPAASRGLAAKSFDLVVAKKALKPAQKKALEDYLMLYVLKQTNRFKKPIQYHTGNQQNWNMVKNSNPLEINPILYSGAYFDTKFVFLHGGYPYLEESVTMARYFPNAYLDLAWMALYSPNAAKRELSDSIDMLAGTQLTFGTDCANLEETYGTIKFMRRVMAEVLAEKIESGYLTEAMALQVARRILYTNAIELYGIKE